MTKEFDWEEAFPGVGEMKGDLSGIKVISEVEEACAEIAKKCVFGLYDALTDNQEVKT